MSSTPDWDKIFNKGNSCSSCGESNFMCDCRDDDIPDFDADEEDEY